jgi:hypothetical protein
LPATLGINQVTATRGKVSIEGQTVTVTLGSVAPGEVVTIHIWAHLNQLAQPPMGHNRVMLLTSSATSPSTNTTADVDFGILGNCATEPPVPPQLPKTGAADEPAGFPLRLAALGLVTVVFGLLIRRRSAKDI